MGKKIIKERPVLEWAIIIGSIVLVVCGLAAPFYVLPNANIAEWGFLSWEPYVTVVSVCMYIILFGHLIRKFRKK